jgi:GGDEF domain-containing protein
MPVPPLAVVGVLAVIVLVAARPRPGGWVLPSVAGFTVVAFCVVAATSPGLDTAVVVPIGLLWLAGWAGFFFARRAALGLVGLSAAGYLVAQLVVDQPVSVMTCVLVVVSIAGAGVAIHGLTQARVGAATHDPLTGTLNRAGLDAAAVPVRATAVRRGEPVTVALADVDRLKVFNDARGHAAGDRLLQSLSTQWRQLLRSQDLLARVGGDEFVFVLPGVSACAADREVLPRLRAAGGEWSWGAVEWAAGQTLSDAIDAADLAMYQDKQARRSGDQRLDP